MAAPNQGLVIDDLRGGFDDNTPPNLLPKDACTIATNVEFFKSALGERRFGCEPLDIAGSDLEDETDIVHLSQWFSTNDVTDSEFWAIGATPGVSVTVAKRTASVWSEVTLTDAITPASPDIFNIVTQALNGKLFFAYPSGVDRLHVWDGTTIRRTGLTQPGPPTAVDEGADAFRHIRFYRIRFIIQDGSGKTVVRSEPSTSLTFTPSGTGKGARVTRSALISESETHWELEASEDDTTFYRIAMIVVGTTTFDDETAISDGINPIPAGLTIPPGYVQLSNAAQILNMTGTVSNGTYSDGVTFAVPGWVMYTGAGVYVPIGWAGHQPPVAGDVTFASEGLALTLETLAGAGTHYATVGTLSEDIGTFLLLPSAKFLIVDGDRLILAGHFTDKTRQSTVFWTPVLNDPGVGNDERLPLTVNNTLSLDNYAGGPITGIAAGISGSWFVFKWGRIYKMTRTGDVQRAYVALTLSTSRGAIPGSIHTGLDENGSPCINFLDPQVGPSRIGVGGLQVISGLRATWRTVNLKATDIVARGVYYPLKKQAHWWIATGAANRPNLKLVLQVSNTRSEGPEGVYRGWSLATGRITQATAVAMLTETVVEDGVTTQRTRPFIGLSTPDYIQRCDSAQDDAGVAYVGTIRSRPFFLAGLLNRWGAMNASLFALAAADSNVRVRLIRDMGLETIEVSPVSLAPTNAETFVIQRLNDLSLSESTCIQVEFTDV